jgi:hypothetical protein
MQLLRFIPAKCMSLLCIGVFEESAAVYSTLLRDAAARQHDALVSVHSTLARTVTVVSRSR